MGAHVWKRSDSNPLAGRTTGLQNKPATAGKEPVGPIQQQQQQLPRAAAPAAGPCMHAPRGHPLSKQQGGPKQQHSAVASTCVGRPVTLAPGGRGGCTSGVRGSAAAVDRPAAKRLKAEDGLPRCPHPAASNPLADHLKTKEAQLQSELQALREKLQQKEQLLTKQQVRTAWLSLAIPRDINNKARACRSGCGRKMLQSSGSRRRR